MSGEPRRAKKDAKSFIATVRVDIRHLASIAAFLKSKGVFVHTKGRVASEAIKLLASHTFTDFPVSRYEDAVIVLEKLGYGNVMSERGTSYYKALLGQVKLEIKTEENIAENTKDWLPTVTELTKEFRQKEAVQTEQTSDEIFKQMEQAHESPLAITSSADLADIDQKSSDEAKQMRTELGMPDVETEGGE